MDEVHRSYNPKGSFLANLHESDPKAIKIGLTGTPLLCTDYNSRSLLGNYIHKYYYNSSIADGYTLRLIREEIETSYSIQLKEILDKIKIQKGSASSKGIYADYRFVEPMLKYIVDDFETSRISMDDNSIGGMVICDSSDQAKQMYKIFQSKYSCSSTDTKELNIAAEPKGSYAEKKENERKVKSALLILHDIGTKQDRKDWIEDYKEGKYDLLFVYNMLLTGFDSPNLKKTIYGKNNKST